MMLRGGLLFPVRGLTRKRQQDYSCFMKRISVIASIRLTIAALKMQAAASEEIV